MTLIRKAGTLRYVRLGERQQWFYAEWGDECFRLWLGPIRLSAHVRVWWVR